MAENGVSDVPSAPTHIVADPQDNDVNAFASPVGVSELPQIVPL
jgi:hypothetical protein